MLKNIGGSPLEPFKVEAKRLLELAPQEQQVKQPKTEEKTRASDRVSLGQEKPEVIGYDAAVKDVDLGSTFMLLRDLVARSLQEQGVATRIVGEGADIDLESLTPEAAQTLVAEDGYFGVDKTSERIVQFAIGSAGNDPSRIDAIRKGIEDGFKQAEDVWGGELPEISYQTHEAIMEKLDLWVSGFDRVSDEVYAGALQWRGYEPS